MCLANQGCQILVWWHSNTAVPRENPLWKSLFFHFHPPPLPPIYSSLSMHQNPFCETLLLSLLFLNQFRLEMSTKGHGHYRRVIHRTVYERWLMNGSSLLSSAPDACLWATTALCLVTCCVVLRRGIQGMPAQSHNLLPMTRKITSPRDNVLYLKYLFGPSTLCHSAIFFFSL